MPFKKLFSALGGDAVANRLSGKTDVLEAVCAGAALVAFADGNCTDDEVATTLTAIKSNPTLNTAFSQSVIESTMDKMFDRAKGGRAARAGLYKEIDDISSKPEDAEMVMYTVLDVADNGGIDPQEEAVCKTIAQRLRLDYNRFLAS